MSAVFREMAPADLEPVVRVFLDCWRGRYSGLLPDPIVDSMTDDRARLLWGRTDAQTVVAVDTSVVGVCRFGRDRDDEATVFSLYVAPAAQGTGVGRALLRNAERALARTGAGTAVLWVFAANTPSIEFYQRHGWSADGSTRLDPDWPVEQIRLAKTVSVEDAA